MYQNLNLRICIFLNRTVILIGLGLTTGCVTTNISPGEPDYWLGKTVDELISNWGEPDTRITNSRNIEILVYEVLKDIEIITGYQRSSQVGIIGEAGALEQTTAKHRIPETITFTVNSEGLIFKHN